MKYKQNVLKTSQFGYGSKPRVPVKETAGSTGMVRSPNCLARDKIIMGCKPYNTRSHRAELFRFSDWDKKFVVKNDKNIEKRVLVAARAFNKTLSPLICRDDKGSNRYIAQQPEQYRLKILHKNAVITGSEKIAYQALFPFQIYPFIEEKSDQEKLASLERIVRKHTFKTDIERLRSVLPRAPARKVVQLKKLDWTNLLPVWCQETGNQNKTLKMATQSIEVLNTEATSILSSPSVEVGCASSVVAPLVEKIVADALATVTAVSETAKQSTSSEVVTPKRTRSQRRNAAKKSLARAVSDLGPAKKTQVNTDDESDIEFDFSKPAPKVTPKQGKPVRTFKSILRKEKSFTDVIKPYANPNPKVVFVEEKLKPQALKPVQVDKMLEQTQRKWVRDNLSQFPYKVVRQMFKEHKSPPKPEVRTPKSMSQWKSALIKAQRERELALYQWVQQPGNKLLKPKSSKPKVQAERKVWKEGEWSGETQLEYVPSFSWALAPNSPYREKPSVVSLNQLMEASRKETIQKKKDEARAKAIAEARAAADKIAARKQALKAKKLAKKPVEVKDLEPEVVVSTETPLTIQTPEVVNLQMEEMKLCAEPAVISLAPTEEPPVEAPKTLSIEEQLREENASLRTEVSEMRNQIKALTEQLAELTSMLRSSALSQKS